MGVTRMAHLSTGLRLALVVFLLLHGYAASAGSGPAKAIAAFHAVQQQPINVSASTTDSRYPALSVTGNAIHIAWEEEVRVYHAHAITGEWADSRSVAVGEQPSVSVDGDGRAHVAFVNQFGGNYEVYYCRRSGPGWTLPRNVSNTSGVSSAPGLAVAPDGTPHVVWVDNTPGYSVIYYAYWDGTYWLNGPVPHATGGAPAVAVGGDGTVHVAWQDRDEPGAPHEIYYSRWDGYSWSLPENLSDSMTQASIIPSIAIDESGQAHVGWQEKATGRYAIYYTWGKTGFWSIPERVSVSESEANLPSLTTARGGAVYVGWDENTLALYRHRSPSGEHWSKPIEVISDPGGVVDLRLAADADGRLHAAWGERSETGKWDIFHQLLVYRVALPLIGRGWRQAP
jgi:hypothetical protein